MALYTERSFDDISADWEGLRRRELQRQQEEQEKAFAEAQEKALKSQQQEKRGGLGGVLAGIGESIGNVGSSLFNMFGTGAASVRDLVTGNAGTGKYTKEWEQYAKKALYGDENMSDKDYRAKTGGKALDAAATVSDFIPGLGAGTRAAMNIGQGAVSGAAQQLIDNGANVSGEDILKGGLIGAGAAGVGNAVGSKLAKGVGGNGKIAKALNSNLGRGAVTGATAGAVGGGLATALNGGDLGQTLSGALEGAGSGALGGATMAGVMGLGGTALDKMRNKISPEAQNVVNQLPESTIAKQATEVETPTTTRRGIAVTDYDAGEQPVKIKRANQANGEYSLGKNAGSTLDGILGPNNKRKLPNAAQQTDAQLLKNLTGEYDNAASIYGREYEPKEALADLKNMLTPEKYNELIGNIRDAADMNQLAFGDTLASSKTDLPMLDRQQYYEDTIGKLGKNGNANLTAADVPEYMRSHLRNDEAKNSLGGSQSDNETILRQLFGTSAENQDLGELYKRYEDLAQSAGANEVYTPENIEAGIRMTGNDDITKALVNKYGLRQSVNVDQYPSLNKPIDVGFEGPQNETVYTKRTLAPKTPENNLPAVRQDITPAVQNETQLIQKGTPEYQTLKQQEYANNRRRELQDTVTTIVRDQYGTIRLNDRIPNLDNAIMELADIGLTGRAEIDGFTNRITGADGEIPKAIRKALNKAGKTDGRISLTMDDVYDTAMASPEAQKAIKKRFDAIGKNYKVDEMGYMDRNDMYDFGRKLEREGYTMIERGGRTENANTESLGEGLRTLGQAFIEKATDGVDVKSTIDANKLKNILPGNERWASKVDDFVNNVKTVQDARSFIAAPTKMSLLAEAAAKNKGTYGQRVGDMGSSAEKAIRAATSANPARAGLQYAAAKTIGSDATKQMIAKNAMKKIANIDAGGNGRTGIKGAAQNIAGGIGNKLSGIGRTLNNETLNNSTFKNYDMLPTFGDIANRQIARQAGLAAAGDVRQSQEQAAANNALMDAYNNYQNFANNAALEEAQYNQQMTEGAQQLQTISDAMSRALAAGDITAYGQLADLYKQAYAIYGKDTETEAKDLTANQSKALTGLQQLETLSQMTPSASTALANSPLGFLVNLTGGDDYANQAQSLALTLGYLQSGANITPREAENIGKSYVPTAYDSEEVRQQKLTRAKQLLQNYLGNTNDLAQ